MTGITPHNDDNLPAVLVDEARAILEQIWHIASDLPADQQAAITQHVGDLYQLIAEDMTSEIESWRDTAQSFKAAAVEFQTQRDAALDELHNLVITREDRHNIILNITHQFDLSQPDAERLLDFLQGTSELEETLSGMDKIDFRDAVYRMAQTLLEEQIWRSELDAEYEAERAADQRRIEDAS